MKAVFKREFFSYFSLFTGYAFISFMLLFTGIYTMTFNLSAQYANFEYVLDNMSFIFLIVIPVLTMRTFAEERKQKTDQLLYSLPIGLSNVVLGKFLALLALFSLPLAVTALYPLILSLFGNVALLSTYAAFLAFFLMGASLLAMGLFVSSLTESQVIAAVMSFLLVLLNYLLMGLSNFITGSARASFIAFSVVIIIVTLLIDKTAGRFNSLVFFTAAEGACVATWLLAPFVLEGLFPRFLKSLVIFDRFAPFVNGIFDLTAIIYYLSLVGLFLFLTLLVLERRRWS